MAENVETLLVELDSTTAKLRSELNKAERTVQGTENKINRSTRAIDRAFDRVSRSASAMGRRINGAVKAAFSLRGAMVAVAGVTGAALAIERTVDSVNSLGKAAKTADLTAESVQELTFAFGQLAEVNDSQVNMSLQRFARRLGLAADGTGAAKDTFGELGVELVDMNGNIRDTQTVLDETLLALARIDSDSFRAAKASEVFGEEAGPKLAAALTGGIKGMNDARQQAHDLGLVLSNETVAGAEEMADEFRILQQRVLKNFQREILANKESILELVAAIGSAITKLGQFARGMAAWSDRKEVEERTEKIEELNDQLFTLLGHQRRLGEELPENFDRNETIHGLGMSLNELDEKIVNTREELERLINVATGGDPSGGGGKGKPLRIDINTGGGSGGSTAPSDSNSMFAGPREAGDLTLEQKEILYKRAQKASKEANESMQDDARETAEALREVTDEQRELERLGADLGFTFSSAFEDAIVEGEKLRTVLQSLAKDIQRIIVRKTVSEPMANAISSAIVSGMSGTSTSGGTAVGDMVPVNTSTGSATGNVFESPSVTRISEQGQPEGVFPLERRNGKLGIRMEGGGGTTIYLDARGADQAAVARIEAALGDLDQSFEARANAAVIEDASRGGALRGAMG